MLLNKHNLEIAKYCGKKPNKGHRTDCLYFTTAGTMIIAENATFAISVSSPGVASDDITGVTDASVALKLDVGNLKPDTALPVPSVKQEGAVTHEMKIDARLLLAVAQSALEFDDAGIVRLQFTEAPNGPVKLDSRNLETGQSWECLLMGRNPASDADAERFDDFEWAIREAERLVG